jgi:hypothetical protein
MDVDQRKKTQEEPRGNDLSRKLRVLFREKIGGLSIFEKLEGKNLTVPQEPSAPGFIVGAPRSGTTLLYQLLVSNYRFAYFTNLASFFYRSPVYFSKRFSLILKRYRSQAHQSRFGLVKGLSAPSEAGQVFRSWFDEGDFSDDRKERIGAALAAMEKLHQGPFLTKNLYNSFRLEKICEIFPRMVLIYMRRDPLYVCQSLLLSRIQEHGDIDTWFGIKPPDYPEITRKDPYEQVVCQVNSIEDHIEEAIQKYHITSVVRIRYEDLCKDPRKEIARILQTYASLEVPVAAIDPCFASQPSMNVKRLTDSQWGELQRALKTILC